MNNKYLLDCIDRQLTFISNELDVLAKKQLVESDRNQGLLSGAYGLITQAKSNLTLLEIEDYRQEND